MSTTISIEARTKIVATVGPASRSPEVLQTLFERGVDVFRINMAHGSIDEHQQTIDNINRLSEEMDRPIGILVDLAGPKIRLGQLKVEPLPCLKNEEVVFVRGSEAASAQELVSNYDRLIDELQEGDTVQLADGTVTLQVEETTTERARCRIIGPGELRSRQGINLPGVALSVPALTENDLYHAQWAADSGADFVSLSFVRTPVEVRPLKQMLVDLGSDASVIAKIEKREALEALEEIVEAADGIMVARGDLGVEMDVTEVPMAQKRIIATSNRLLKPVIVATQMLDSMENSRHPTRAEVSDVANAILDGADACMLSGETAIGKYPIDAVEMMNRIMLNTERSQHDAPGLEPPPVAVAGIHPITSAVVYGASRVAAQLFARLVVVATRSGRTARIKSKQRDYIPTIGISDSTRTLRRMCLYWGIHPVRSADLRNGPQLREFIQEWGRQNGQLETGDRVVTVTGSDLIANAHNVVVVHEVG